MKTATLLKGTVKFKAGKPLTFEHGDRINIVVTLSNGEDVKIWGNPGDPIATLAKGAAIQLLHDGEHYTLLQTGEQIPQPPAPQAQPQALPPSPAALAMSAPATRITVTPSMSADVKEWLSIFTELEQARPDLKEETRRAATSTLFMQRLKIREEFSQDL
jgi:hypothetical protein